MSPHLVVFIRSALGFISLLALCRGIGRRFDLILPVVFGVLAAVVSFDRDLRVGDAWIALATWGGLSLLVELAAVKSEPFRKGILGSPTVLVERGKIQEKNLAKTRMTIADMMAMLREKNAFQLSDVEFAALETDGQVSVLLKSDAQPVTPKTAGIQMTNEAAPVTLIEDGTILLNTLLVSGKSTGWLLQEVQRQGARDFDDVILAQLDAKGNLYVDLVDDTILPNPSEPTRQVRLTLYASLKKIQADLEMFSMQTENPTAKQSFEQGSVQLQGVIDRVTGELTKK